MIKEITQYVNNIYFERFFKFREYWKLSDDMQGRAEDEKLTKKDILEYVDKVDDHFYNVINPMSRTIFVLACIIVIIALLK